MSRRTPTCWRSETGPVPGDAPATAWFHRITRERGTDRTAPSVEPPREIPPDELRGGFGGDESQATPSELSVLPALGVLDPRSRAAIVLRYYHDHDYETIGRILGTSPGNVGVLLTRALDRLRPVLEPEPIGGAR